MSIIVSLGVGGVRGDYQRRVTTGVKSFGNVTYRNAAGPFFYGTTNYADGPQAGSSSRYDSYFDNNITTPTGPRNHGSRYISDARVYLGVLKSS